MTLKELFENAHLDALGLLDGAEQEAFERAFSEASPEVKAQIRAEQARWAAEQVLLPDVQPSPDLKDRVMAAVAAAAVRAEVESNSDPAPLPFHPTLRVSRWWRVSAVAAAAAVVALTAAFVYVTGTNENLRSQIAMGQFDDAFRLTVGRGTEANKHLHDLFLSLDVSKNTLTPTQYALTNGFAGEAALLSSKNWSESRLAYQLNPGVTYCLVAVSRDGQRIDRRLSTFTANGGPQSFTIEPLEKGTTLAILAVVGTEALDISKALLMTTI
jgi:hypothetical protein